METGPVSEVLCAPVFRIPENGQNPHNPVIPKNMFVKIIHFQFTDVNSVFNVALMES
jgi:hypothetical protein